MTTLRQAALAVIARWDLPHRHHQLSTTRIFEDLRTALEEPEQEPVGYVFTYRDIIGSVIGAKGEWAPHEIALYGAPVEAPENQVLQAKCAAFLANVQLLEVAIEARAKERDALLAAAKLALEACVGFSCAPMTQVKYLSLLRVIVALKAAGVQ